VHIIVHIAISGTGFTGPGKQDSEIGQCTTHTCGVLAAMGGTEGLDWGGIPCGSHGIMGRFTLTELLPHNIMNLGKTTTTTTN
jgi:hypothetical protein